VRFGKTGHFAVCSQDWKSSKQWYRNKFENGLDSLGQLTQQNFSQKPLVLEGVLVRQDILLYAVRIESPINFHFNCSPHPHISPYLQIWFCVGRTRDSAWRKLAVAHLSPFAGVHMWIKAHLVPGNRVWLETGLQDHLTTQDLFRKNNWNVWHLPWGKMEQVAPESWYLSIQYMVSTEQDGSSDKISAKGAWFNP